jgi:hypothetical protein
LSYRNDLLLILKQSDALSEKIKEYELWVTGDGLGSVLENIEFCFSVREDSEEFVEFTSSFSRWDSTCKRVQKVEAFMNWLDSECLDKYYQFLRLGDQLTDIEDRGLLAAYYVHRSFEPRF